MCSVMEADWFERRKVTVNAMLVGFEVQSACEIVEGFKLKSMFEAQKHITIQPALVSAPMV